MHVPVNAEAIHLAGNDLAGSPDVLGQHLVGEAVDPAGAIGPRIADFAGQLDQSHAHAGSGLLGRDGDDALAHLFVAVPKILAQGQGQARLPFDVGLDLFGGPTHELRGRTATAVSRRGSHWGTRQLSPKKPSGGTIRIMDWVPSVAVQLSLYASRPRPGKGGFGRRTGHKWHTVWENIAPGVRGSNAKAS